MASGTLQLCAGEFVLEMTDEPVVPFERTEPDPRYDQLLTLGDMDFVTCRHGIRCFRGEAVSGSLLIAAAGGPSAVHDRSLVIVGTTCFAAVGPFVVAMTVPDLSVVWHRAIDSATCFGVCVTPQHDALISHGELEISRVTLFGEIVWQQGGADVFTGPLLVSPDSVQVSDFNGQVYVFDAQTGA